MDCIDGKPDFKTTITNLKKGYRHFHIESGKANSFTVNVIIHKGDKIKGHSHREVAKKNITNVNVSKSNLENLTTKGNKVTLDHYQNFTVRALLNYYMRKGVPFYVKSGILGVNKSDLYLITANPSRKQEFLDYVVWELTFTKYDKVKYAKFSKTTKGIKSALSKGKKKKQGKSAKTKEREKLRKCKRSVLVYSKKKKVVPCVKILQTILYLDGCLTPTSQIDGWYGKKTFEAVKKYQKKYAQMFGLKQTGTMNQRTYDVMIGKGKAVQSLSHFQGKQVQSTNITSVYKEAKSKKKSTKKSNQVGKTVRIKSNIGGVLR